jgi:DNA-binding NarL/FixJ family response regulator
MVMTKTKLLIIDEQEIFRTGVRKALSRDAEFEISECSSTVDMIRFVKIVQPDIVLLGSRLNNARGLDFSVQLSRNFPRTRVIFLSPDPLDQELFDVIKSSATAFVNKNATTEQLVATIQKAVEEEKAIPVTKARNTAEIEADFFEGPVRTDVSSNSPTPRELEILAYVADGNTNKQIAQTLHISEQTIKNHVSNILRRSRANDRAHAVTIAIRNGWISAGALQPA